MYESFGAVVSDHGVAFRLFLPDTSRDSSQYMLGGPPRISEIRVVGSFQSELGGRPWDVQAAPAMQLVAHPSGQLFEAQIDPLADGFYQYKYFVTFQNGTSRWCTDPCTRYVAGALENAGFVIGGNDVVVEPIAERLPLSDLVIYELMVDDFTAGERGERAPFDAVRDRLDYLQRLGVNAIEFMPWTAWRGGTFSWGYDPFLFFAVEDRYLATAAEPLDRLVRLKHLVNELHARGMHVIMDGVFNHVSAGKAPDTGFPYHWLYENPEESPFTGGFANGGYFEDLDYNNACTEQFIHDVCKFWLDEYRLDGIRFDYTLGFFQPGNLTQGIPKIVGDLRADLVAAERDNVVFVLEHMTDNRYEAIDATNTICADACWYDRFLFDVPEASATGHPEGWLMRVLQTGRDFAPGKGPVVYIENHDHSSAVSRAGGRGRWWKTQAPLIALLTCPGAVMLHNGQELGDDYWLPDDGDGRVLPRPVRWELADDPAGEALLALHEKLIRIRREHPALRSANFHPAEYDQREVAFDPDGYGVHRDLGVAIYHRWGQGAEGRTERFIVAINFSDSDCIVDVPFSTNGEWHDLLNDESVEVQDWRWRGARIPSNWARVLWREE